MATAEESEISLFLTKCNLAAENYASVCPAISRFFMYKNILNILNIFWIFYKIFWTILHTILYTILVHTIWTIIILNYGQPKHRKEPKSRDVPDPRFYRISNFTGLLIRIRNLIPDFGFWIWRLIRNYNYQIKGKLHRKNTLFTKWFS